MKSVWLCWRLPRQAVCDASSFVPAPIGSSKRDGLHAHGTEARDEKCRRKSFAIDFAVQLVGRLVDTHWLQKPGKLFVTDAAVHHFFLNHPLRLLFPRRVRRPQRASTFLLRFHHASPLGFPNLPSHNPLTTIFGRIRPNAHPQLYTPSASHFLCEDRMLTKRLQKTADTKQNIPTPHLNGKTEGQSPHPERGVR